MHVRIILIYIVTWLAILTRTIASETIKCMSVNGK